MNIYIFTLCLKGHSWRHKVTMYGRIDLNESGLHEFHLFFVTPTLRSRSKRQTRKMNG